MVQNSGMVVVFWIQINHITVGSILYDTKSILISCVCIRIRGNQAYSDTDIATM